MARKKRDRKGAATPPPPPSPPPPPPPPPPPQAHPPPQPRITRSAAQALGGVKLESLPNSPQRKKRKTTPKKPADSPASGTGGKSKSPVVVVKGEDEDEDGDDDGDGDGGAFKAYSFSFWTILVEACSSAERAIEVKEGWNMLWFALVCTSFVPSDDWCASKPATLKTKLSSIHIISVQYMKPSSEQRRSSIWMKS